MAFSGNLRDFGSRVASLLPDVHNIVNRPVKPTPDVKHPNTHMFTGYDLNRSNQTCNIPGQPSMSCGEAMAPIVARPHFDAFVARDHSVPVNYVTASHRMANRDHAHTRHVPTHERPELQSRIGTGSALPATSTHVMAGRQKGKSPGMKLTPV